MSPAGDMNPGPEKKDLIMTRIRAAVMCGVTLSMLSFFPGQAEEPSAPGQEAAAQTEGPSTQVAEAPPSSPSSGNGGVKELLSGLPKRLPAFLAGAIVGTPIAIVRLSKRETIAATKELSGETSNPLIVLPCASLGLPAGIISGCFQGVLYGPINGWKYSDDKPYSKESFSLGEMK